MLPLDSLKENMWITPIKGPTQLICSMFDSYERSDDSLNGCPLQIKALNIPFAIVESVFCKPNTICIDLRKYVWIKVNKKYVKEYTNSFKENKRTTGVSDQVQCGTFLNVEQ